MDRRKFLANSSSVSTAMGVASLLGVPQKNHAKTNKSALTVPKIENGDFKGKRIVIAGDSIVAKHSPYGDGAAKALPEHAVFTIRICCPGNSTPGNAERMAQPGNLFKYALAYRPDIFWFNAGVDEINDMGKDSAAQLAQRMDTFKNGIKKLAAAFKAAMPHSMMCYAAHTRVSLCPDNASNCRRRNVDILKVNEWAKETCASIGIPFMDVYKFHVDHDLQTPDGRHFNKAGQRKMGEGVKQLLEPYLNTAGGPWAIEGSPSPDQVFNARDKVLLWPRYAGPLSLTTNIRVNNASVADNHPLSNGAVFKNFPEGNHKVHFEVSDNSGRKASFPEYSFKVVAGEPEYVTLPLKVNLNGAAGHGFVAGKQKWDGKVAHGYIPPCKVNTSGQDRVEDGDPLVDIIKSGRVSGGPSINARYLIRTKETGKLYLGLILLAKKQHDPQWASNDCDVYLNGKLRASHLNALRITEAGHSTIVSFETQAENDLLDISVMMGVAASIKPGIWGLILSKDPIPNGKEYTTLIHEQNIFGPNIRTQISGQHVRIKVIGFKDSERLSITNINGVQISEFHLNGQEAMWRFQGHQPGHYFISHQGRVIGRFLIPAGI